jgi:hypothetical protein
MATPSAYTVIPFLSSLKNSPVGTAIGPARNFRALLFAHPKSFTQ